MSMIIWTDEAKDEGIDLGDPFIAWGIFSELAKAAPGEDWPELYGVPHMAEQEVGAEWLAKVREQAKAFLQRHGRKLSERAQNLLADLAESDEPHQ